MAALTMLAPYIAVAAIVLCGLVFFGLVAFVVVVWLVRRSRSKAAAANEPAPVYFDPYAPSAQESMQMNSLVRKAKMQKAELDAAELMKNAVTYAGK